MWLRNGATKPACANPPTLEGCSFLERHDLGLALVLGWLRPASGTAARGDLSSSLRPLLLLKAAKPERRS